MSLGDLARLPWESIWLDPAKWPEGSLPGTLARGEMAYTQLWFSPNETETRARGGRFFSPYLREKKRHD